MPLVLWSSTLCHFFFSGAPCPWYSEAPHFVVFFSGAPCPWYSEAPHLVFFYFFPLQCLRFSGAPHCHFSPSSNPWESGAGDDLLRGAPAASFTNRIFFSSLDVYAIDKTVLGNVLVTSASFLLSFFPSFFPGAHRLPQPTPTPRRTPALSRPFIRPESGPRMRAAT